MSAGKRAAGVRAAELVEPGMRLGLGTGSTVAYFLDALAERQLEGIAGVATSTATENRCRELGIELLGWADFEQLDLGVDGADELTSDLILTKGGGGALLREKVVAQSCDEFVVIATESKLVERLGISFALPVEVIPQAAPRVAKWLLGVVGNPLGITSCALRGDGDYHTDNGNQILDVTFAEGINHAADTDAQLRAIPGVVETGLFTTEATRAILGDDDGSVRELGSVASAQPA